MRSEKEETMKLLHISSSLFVLGFTSVMSKELLAQNVYYNSFSSASEFMFNGNLTFRQN